MDVICVSSFPKDGPKKVSFLCKNFCRETEVSAFNLSGVRARQLGRLGGREREGAQGASWLALKKVASLQRSLQGKALFKKSKGNIGEMHSTG